MVDAITGVQVGVEALLVYSILTLSNTPAKGVPTADQVMGLLVSKAVQSSSVAGIPTLRYPLMANWAESGDSDAG